MTVPQAIEIKEELETIDRLLKQLEEAARAQIGIIDLDALAEFAEPGDLDKLAQMQRQVEELLRHMAEQQGLERGKSGYQLTPESIPHFPRPAAGANLFPITTMRTGRHQGPIGEGAVELQQTKTYEFGDSVANMDIPHRSSTPCCATDETAGAHESRRHRDPSHA